jgi:hypothetical protein
MALLNKTKISSTWFYFPQKQYWSKKVEEHCGGTASEKVDHAARKYRVLNSVRPAYKDSKVLIVFCAGRTFQESTLQFTIKMQILTLII